MGRAFWYGRWGRSGWEPLEIYNPGTNGRSTGGTFTVWLAR